MMIKLDTTPDSNQIYTAVATVHDPRTDQGMEEEPHAERPNQTRLRAMQFAKEWAEQGYFASVYNDRTGECILDYSPR